MDTKPRLLFTYGSLLSAAMMGAMCPEATPYGTARFPDWRLVFREVADIEPSEGSHVVGALYEISPEDEARLDQYEGIDRGLYRKVEFRVNTDDGERIAFFYKMNATGVYPPNASYFMTIQQGFEDWALPKDTLVAAYREAVAAFPKPTKRDAYKLRKNRRHRRTGRKGKRLTK